MLFKFLVSVRFMRLSRENLTKLLRFKYAKHTWEGSAIHPQSEVLTRKKANLLEFQFNLLKGLIRLKTLPIFFSMFWEKIFSKQRGRLFEDWEMNLTFRYLWALNSVTRKHLEDDITNQSCDIDRWSYEQFYNFKFCFEEDETNMWCLWANRSSYLKCNDKINKVIFENSEVKKFITWTIFGAKANRAMGYVQINFLWRLQRMKCLQWCYQKMFLILSVFLFDDFHFIFMENF